MGKKRIYIFFLLAFFFLFVNSVNGLNSINIPVEKYTAPDLSFSLLYPAGWTIQSDDAGITILEDPDDPNTMGIDIMAGYKTDQITNSHQLINALSQEMLNYYPDLKLKNTQQISNDPDISGTLFYYTNSENMTIGGLGISICHGDAIIWADIYGPEAKITKINPAEVLLFVLMSANSGSEPNNPQFAHQESNEEPQPQPEAAQQKNQESEFMHKAEEAFMWNNLPYIAPDVFKIMPPLF